MQVGDKVRRVPSILSGEVVFQEGQRTKKPLRERELPGEITYIHPQRRYYTIRFFCAGGSFCESFPFEK